MEAHIPAPNVRVFARALQTLAKIGDVLIIETAPDRLLIRALSQAQSSYAQISFSPSFFTHYILSPTAAVPSAAADGSMSGRLSVADAEDTAEFSYRARPNSAFSTTGSYPSPSPPIAAVQRPHKVIVNSRGCLTPFRGAVSMIKRLTIKLTTEEDCSYSELSTQHSDGGAWQSQQQLAGSQRGRRKRRAAGRRGESEGGRRGIADMEVEKDLCLMMQLHLDDLGVTKTYRIPTTEQTNILQPDFSRQSCPTVLSAKASKFQSWLANFQNDVDELSLSCGLDSLRLRSYQDWQSAGLLDPHTAAGLSAVGESENTASSNKADRAKRQRIKGIVVTESSIANSELDTRQLHDTCLNNPLIFTLAELKQFVALCEMTDEELFVFAQAPGHPILITNTRKPFQSIEQQRAAAMGRQQQQQPSEQQESGLTAEDGRDGLVVSSLVPPSPASVGGSEYSYSTAAAMEQSQRTWSGELILSTLAPDVTMPPPSFSPSPSPSPAQSHDGSQPTPLPTQTSSQPLPNRQQQPSRQQ